MTADTHDVRLTLKERLVIRLLGIHISRDGTRWTAPRRLRGFVEGAVLRVHGEAWKDGATTRVERTDDSVTYAGPKRTITIRFVP